MAVGADAVSQLALDAVPVVRANHLPAAGLAEDRDVADRHVEPPQNRRVPPART
jgi:hypothetical protein